MNKQNLINLEKDIEGKYTRKDKKKKQTMKISGASVRKLSKIITARSKASKK
jgi:hypothetical protein